MGDMAQWEDVLYSSLEDMLRREDVL